MSDELLEFWDSFCTWSSWGEWTPSSAIAWVGSRHWAQPRWFRSVLVGVFLELVTVQRKAQQKPPQEAAEQGPDARVIQG